MPIDASIYDTKSQAPSNPLDMIVKAAGIGNTVQSTQNERQKNILLQQSQRGNEIGISQEEAKLGMQNMENASRLIVPLLSNPNASIQDIHKGIDEGANVYGLYPKSYADSLKASFSADNPQQNREKLFSMLLGVQDYKTQLEQTFGAPETINTGRATLYGVRDPAWRGGGFLQAGKDEATGEVRQYMSPETAAQRVQVLGPEKEITTRSLGPMTPDSGYNYNLSEDKELEEELENFSNDSSIGKKSKYFPDQQPFSPPPDFQKRLDASQARVDTIRNEATEAAPRISTLNKVLDLSRSGAMTGPISKRIGGLYTNLVDLGVATPGMETSAQQLGQIQKYLKDTLSNYAIKGETTNQKLDLLERANANDEQLPEVLQEVARYALANAKGKIIRQNLVNRVVGERVDPEKEEQFKATLDKVYDPQAVELTLMQPEEITKFLKKLPNAAARERVKNNYLALKELGAFE